MITGFYQLIFVARKHYHTNELLELGSFLMLEQQVSCNQVDSKVDATSPGQILKNAREAKKMSVSEVASKLYLTTERVQEIEANCYKHISSLIYLKGYLRAYARLIGIAEERVLAALEKTGIPEQFTVACLPFKEAELNLVCTRARSNGYLWLLGISVLAILVIAICLYEFKNMWYPALPSPAAAHPNMPSINQSQIEQMNAQIKPTAETGNP